MANLDELRQLKRRLAVNFSLVILSLLLIFLGEAIVHREQVFRIDTLVRFAKSDILFIFLFSIIELLSVRYIENKSDKMLWTLIVACILGIFIYVLIIAVPIIILDGVLVGIGFISWLVLTIIDFKITKKHLNSFKQSQGEIAYAGHRLRTDE